MLSRMADEYELKMVDCKRAVRDAEQEIGRLNAMLQDVEAKNSQMEFQNIEMQNEMQTQIEEMQGNHVKELQDLRASTVDV